MTQANKIKSASEDRYPRDPSGLNVLDVYEISWHGVVCTGILLSRDMDYERRDKTGEEVFYWDVAMSYHGGGCQIAKLTDDDVKTGKFIGTVP